MPGLARVLTGREVFDAVVDAPGQGLQKALASAAALRGVTPSDVLFLVSGREEGAEALAARLARVGHLVVTITNRASDEAGERTLVLPADALVNDALVAIAGLEGMPYLLPDEDGEAALFGAEAPRAAQTIAEVPPERPPAIPAPGPFGALGDPDELAPSRAAEPAMAEEEPTEGPPAWVGDLTPSAPPPGQSEAGGSTPDLDAPAWAEEPPVRSDEEIAGIGSFDLGAEVRSSEEVDGPPEWLSDVVGTTATPQPSSQPSAAPVLEPQESSVGVIAASEDEVDAEFEFSEDDDIPLPDLEDLPRPASWRKLSEPQPAWDVVVGVHDQPPPRRLDPGERPKVIAFTVPKGGTGKTTTAVNGARILASLEDTKVLLIDANAQQADAAETLYVNESAPTIVDLTFDDEPMANDA